MHRLYFEYCFIKKSINNVVAWDIKLPREAAKKRYFMNGSAIKSGRGGGRRGVKLLPLRKNIFLRCFFNLLKKFRLPLSSRGGVISVIPLRKDYFLRLWEGVKKYLGPPSFSVHLGDKKVKSRIFEFLFDMSPKKSNTFF